MEIPIVGLVGLVALVWKVVDFIRLVANGSQSKSGIVTQLVAWVGGIMAVVLYAASDFASTVSIGDKPLDKLSFVTLVLVGMALGSIASASVDVKQAIDATDSSVKPKLFER